MDGNNEQLNIREFGQAVDLLDQFKGMVERGEVMSVLVICEGTDGSIFGGTTGTQNQYTLAGAMLSWALRRLGFTRFDDVRMMSGSKE